MTAAGPSGSGPVDGLFVHELRCQIETLQEEVSSSSWCVRAWFVFVFVIVIRAASE